MKLYFKQALRLLSSVLLVGLLGIPAWAAQSDFPVPDSIRPAIAFWIKVYTEADTQSGFLHDSRDLRVIYGKLDRDRDLIEAERKRIIADLRVLAGGKRDGLTASQRHLVELWGASTPNARFEEAAGNVRWQLGQSDRYREGLVRSGAYRDYIEDVVREKGLPPELAALPHVESSFHPGAYSSVAASGMWQFMRETAQRFMQVDLVVDERLDPYIATHAAMELLKYNYDALDSWPLALTAYNHGTNGMARAVRDTGTRDIGRIISDYKGPRFGFASRNFYPQFLAALEVERNAERYFGPLVLDPYPEFASVTLGAFMDAADIAVALGVSVDTLRRYNPALLPAVWSGNKRIPKGFELKIDRAVFRGDLQASIDGISSTGFYTAQIPDVSYQVRSGDSLSAIASRFNTSVAELVAINQLRDRNRIRIGQTLVLPQSDGGVPTLVVNDTVARPVPDTGRYEVQRGDTVSLIARRFELEPATLLALNGLEESGLIFPGQELRLRPEEGTAAPTVPNVQAQLAAAVADGGEEGGEAEETEATDVLEADSAVSEAFANAVAAQEAGAQAAEQLRRNADVLAADPADFAVSGDGTIEILAEETLGHYAEWLGMRAADLRRLNGMRYGSPVMVGDRLKLAFSEVDQATFEQRRRQYHSDLQARYFAAWRIRNTESYSIKRSDFLMNLAQQRSVPMWLFRQYNPEVDAASLQIGQVIVFPVVERITN